MATLTVRERKDTKSVMNERRILQGRRCQRRRGRKKKKKEGSGDEKREGSALYMQR